MSDQEQRANLISRTPITACTRCGQIADQVSHLRCHGDALGEHKWWTGLRKDWFSLDR